MALPPGDVSRLLRELRGAGPVDRLRLLGRSISALRGLSPWDRKILLRMAGFDGAEALVERLAGDDRETARALSRVLEQLEAHPDDFERTVRKLGDPKRRGEAVDELLATLDRVAAEEAAPAAHPPAPPPAARAAVPSAPPAPEPVAPTPPPSAAIEEPPREEAPPREPSAKPAPARRTAPEPEPPERSAPDRPSRPRPPVRPLEPALPAEARSAVGALESLLDLRRRLDAGRRPGPAELRRQLEREMPFPWARRRAIQAWLAAGAGDDLEAVLDLVDTLPPGSDRTWCLATLAGAHPWSAEAWRRITEAASPEKRRHLELRRRHS